MRIRLPFVIAMIGAVTIAATAKDVQAMVERQGIAPIKMKGATGSPGNPVALY